jgi:hypothetical protein
MGKFLLAVALCGLSSFLVHSKAVAAENLVVNSASTAVCTDSKLKEWQHVRAFSQGVAGRDPVGERIGPSPAYRRFHGKNWYPLDTYKKTLCGVLHHFSFYDPWSSGDEADWNNFFIPAAPYAYLIEDARPLMETYVINNQVLDVWHDCRVPSGSSQNNCLEAELTPDEHFYDNPWFNARTEFSPLEGQGACTYGPWVFEEAHGNRPEIHPSELYWWRARVDRGPFFLMVLQDDSNRFDNKDHFAVSPDPPDWWRAWAASPRTAEFKIAFEVKLLSGVLYTYELRNLASRNVVTWNDPVIAQDADDGKEHAIEYDGKVVLNANELQATDDDVGVQFVDLCRDAANTRLQGYLRVMTKVGKGSQGDEGYQVLRVDRHGSDSIVRKVAITFTEMKREVGFGDVSLTITGDGTTLRFPQQGAVDLPKNRRVATSLTLTAELDPLESFSPALSVHKGTGELIGRSGVKLTNTADLLPGSGSTRVSRTREEGPENEPHVVVLDSLEISYRVAVEKVGSVIPEVVMLGRPVTMQMVKSTLRRVVLGGKPELVADFKINVRLEQQAAASLQSVSKVHRIDGSRRTVLPFTADADARGGTVKHVPVLSGGTIEVSMQSGKTVPVSSPPIALGASAHSVSTRAAVPERGAWENIAEVLSPGVVAPATSLLAIKLQEWDMEVLPDYAPVREGHVVPGDDAPTAEVLNEVLREGANERRQALFASDRPVAISWSFKAVNLLNKADVPVKVGGAAAPTEAQVIFVETAVDKVKLKVRFPEQPNNGVYELIATGTMKDTLGRSGQIQRQFSSHALTADTPEMLVDGAIRAAATLARVSPTDALSSSILNVQPHNEQIADGARQRRARTLRLITMHAAEDGQITTRELSRLVDAARRLQAQ